MQTGEFRVNEKYKKYLVSGDAHHKKFLTCEAIQANNEDIHDIENFHKTDIVPHLKKNMTEIFKLPLTAGMKSSELPARPRPLYSEIFHKDRPFFIQIMSTDSKKCSACDIDIAWKDEASI